MMNRVYEIWDNFLRAQRAKRVKNIIKRYNLSLVRAICYKVNHAMSIAIDLMDINMIPDRVYYEFQKTVNNHDPITDMLFASTMMTRVRRALYEDPDAFPVVMNSFRKHDSLNEVVILMEKEYYDDTITINSFNIFIVSFVLGLILGVILFFLFWTSSPVVMTHCTEGGSRQLLLKLSQSIENQTNLTQCLSSHHMEGRTLLTHYYTWCNNNTTTNTTNVTSDSDNKLLSASTILQYDDNETYNSTLSSDEFLLLTHRLCTMIETLYHNDSMTVMENESSIISEKEGRDKDIERTWCLSDLSLLLKCLNIQNY